MPKAKSLEVITTAANETIIYDLDVDIKTKRYFDNKLKPNVITQQQAEWLYACNNKYQESDVDDEKTGKWMLFISSRGINHIWNKIKKGIIDGELWHAKVSTKEPERDVQAIMIYTKDYTDLEDVIRVLNYLEEIQIKRKDRHIRYKTNKQTRAGIYSGGEECAWVYTSETIHTLLNNEASNVPITDTIAEAKVQSPSSAISANIFKEEQKVTKQIQRGQNLFKANKQHNSNSKTPYISSDLSKNISNMYAVLQEDTENNEETNNSYVVQNKQM